LKTVQELRTEELTPPQTISGILHSGWAVRILKTACEISVFEVLQDGPKDAKTVAETLSVPLNGISLLLDALVGLRLIERADLAAHGGSASIAGGGPATYVLNDESRVYLLKDSALFMGMYLKQQEELDKMWRSLTDTLTTGKPVMEVNLDARAEEIFPQLAEAIVPLNYAIACDVVQFLKSSKDYFDEPLTVLDVACGGAPWSIPFVQENAFTKVDALDFPAVLAVTKKSAEKFGVEPQYRYLPGNWSDVSVDGDHYDAAILGHILHSEGKERSAALIAYCHKALRPGGVLVIAEFMTNKEHNGPLFPLMFGLNMYLATTCGCVFSFDQLKEMCFDAGFADVIRHSGIRYDSPAVLAFK
jgi:2-polyprenyl-3-methyl-5-hydroxy-6-metoxy-1,4-benzoquinol methylase